MPLPVQLPISLGPTLVSAHTFESTISPKLLSQLPVPVFCVRNRRIKFSTLDSRTSSAEEVRIRYVQTTTRAESLLHKIRDTILEGVEVAEEKIGTVSRLNTSASLWSCTC